MKGFQTILFYSLAIIVFAQPAEDNLYDLSLDQLNKLVIKSASKKEENIHRAPSVITVITADDINRFGGQNLYEILERAPSFYGIYSLVFPKNVIGLRSSLQTHIDPNILFLIDGRPFRESVKGGQMVGILAGMPASFIESVEIIRGPGSVLYGTNAFIGVVNVITKKDRKHIEISTFGGSFGSRGMDLNGSASVKELTMNYGTSLMAMDGWSFADSTWISQRNGTRQFARFDRSEHRFANRLGLCYKSFSINSFHTKTQLANLDALNSHVGTYEAERFFLDLGLTDSLTRGYRIEANITYNNIHDVFGPDSATQVIDGNDWVIELNNFITISEKINLLLGGTLYGLEGSQQTPDRISVPPYNKVWTNVYFQSDIQLKERMKLVAGGQLNKIPNHVAYFVPRMAFLAEGKKGFGMKLMFGLAFRAPYPGETDVNLDIVIGDPGLDPEIITTYEAQLYCDQENLSVNLTVFRNKIRDIITRVPNIDLAESDLIYANQGKISSMGTELEFKYRTGSRGYLLGNYSFLHSESINFHESRFPSHMLKVGYTRVVTYPFTFGVFNSFYSMRFNDETAIQIVDGLKAFSWLSAKLNYNLPLNEKLSDFHLFIEGSNLLNLKVYDPEIIFGSYNAINLRSGLLIRGGLGLSL